MAEQPDRQQEIDDILTVLSTRQGRRYLWRIMGEAGVFRMSFIAGAADATAFNEGKRNLGASILTEIMDHAPKLFLTMQQEAIQDDEERKARESGDGGGRDDDGSAPG